MTGCLGSWKKIHCYWVRSLWIDVFFYMRWTNCQSHLWAWFHRYQPSVFALSKTHIFAPETGMVGRWSLRFPFWSFWVISYTTNLGTLRIIGPSYGGVWLSIGGFWDLQTISFEIPWFLGKVFFPRCQFQGPGSFHRSMEMNPVGKFQLSMVVPPETQRNRKLIGRSVYEDRLLNLGIFVFKLPKDDASKNTPKFLRTFTAGQC